MTVSSTSEWNYPETLAIESEEISELGRFIYDKVRWPIVDFPIRMII